MNITAGSLNEMKKDALNLYQEYTSKKNHTQKIEHKLADVA